MSKENSLPKAQISSEASSQSSKARTKGANKPLASSSSAGSKKNVLGKGLNALMAASAVKVDFGTNEKKEEPSRARDSKSFSFSPGAAVPRPEELQRSISREQALSRPSQVEKIISQANDNVNPPEGGLVYLALDRIFANPKQPRKIFRDDELKELAASIRVSGVLQPIVVRRQAGASGPLAKYEIIAGERRFRAATKVGVKRIPALVRQMSDREVLEVSIVENVQRQDLNPLEEAEAYSRLINEFGSSQEEVASAVGKSRSAVANALRLLKLDEATTAMLSEGAISAGHARALLSLSDERKRVELAKQVVDKGLSVREAEQLASGKSNILSVEAAKSQPEVDPSVVELEQRLRRALGTKVKLLKKKNGRGELRISFFSDDELGSLVERIA